MAPKDIYEKIGGTASFRCKLPNDGAPVLWMHNGKQIFPEKNPAKYEIFSDGPFRTLVIKDLKEEEQGLIGVKLGNKLTTAKLKIAGQISHCIFFVN